MTLQGVIRRLRVEAQLSATAARRATIKLYLGNDFTHAAAIAYYALLSLFPFLLLVIALLGAVTADDADRTAVLTFVLQYVPAQLDFVMTQLDAFRRDGVQIGVGGALGLVWGSLGVFGAITSAVNEAWGVEKQRSFWKHRLVSFLMLVAAGVATLVALMLVSLVEVAQATVIGQLLASIEWIVLLQTFVFRYLAVLLLIFAVGLVFYFVPNAKTRFRDVWVGAILTGLLWNGALIGFSWYLQANQRLSMIHGSITAVVVFLLWIYISAVILIYGVEFTAAYARLRRHRTDTMPAAATPRV